MDYDYNFNMETLRSIVREAINYTANNARDVNSKDVFESPELYAQFLRDNVNIPILKNVRPEDIEDVTKQYRPYLGVEFDADTVKKVRLRDKDGELLETPLYLICLTEHKSDVDYDVSMQLLKYMVGIWRAHALEQDKQQKDRHKNKSFQYPPILPIVYYEGKKKWTAGMQLSDRIMMKEIFQDCIPDFRYEIVRIHDFDNEELLARGDEMSLIMLFNNIQNTMDLAEFLKLPKGELDRIIKDTPEYIIDIIAEVMKALCVHINASPEETEQCIKKVKERKMGYLFENAEKMDIQAERRKTAEALQRLEEAEHKATEAEQKATEAERKTKEAKLQVAEAEQKTEQTVKAMIEYAQELGANQNQLITRLIEKFNLDQQEAEESVEKYWKA